nr:hypothetical protein GCM10020185_87500 [Pseudomonas brassicacearum subsp. brassicacearum]
MVADQTGYPAEDIVKKRFRTGVRNSAGSEKSVKKLNVQYRMLPSIGRVVADTFYDKDLKPGRTHTDDEEKG